MTKIYYGNSDNFRGVSDSEIETLCDKRLLSKIERFRRPVDKWNSIMGRYLLSMGLKDFGFPQHHLKEISYNPFGRPELASVKLNFSISHSETLVLCAVSASHHIGLDVEFIKDFNFVELIDRFHQEEIKAIQAGGTYAFYTVWTRKEALLKATGTGFQAELDTFNVSKTKTLYHQQNWVLCNFTLKNDFLCCLASNSENCFQLVEWVGV